MFRSKLPNSLSIPERQLPASKPVGLSEHQQKAKADSLPCFSLKKNKKSVLYSNEVLGQKLGITPSNASNLQSTYLFLECEAKSKTLYGCLLSQPLTDEEHKKTTLLGRQCFQCFQRPEHFEGVDEVWPPVTVLSVLIPSEISDLIAQSAIAKLVVPSDEDVAAKSFNLSSFEALPCIQRLPSNDGGYTSENSTPSAPLSPHSPLTLKSLGYAPLSAMQKQCQKWKSPYFSINLSASRLYNEEAFVLLLLKIRLDNIRLLRPFHLFLEVSSNMLLGGLSREPLNDQRCLELQMLGKQHFSWFPLSIKGTTLEAIIPKIADIVAKLPELLNDDSFVFGGLPSDHVEDADLSDLQKKSKRAALPYISILKNTSFIYSREAFIIALLGDLLSDAETLQRCHFYMEEAHGLLLAGLSKEALPSGVAESTKELGLRNFSWYSSSVNLTVYFTSVVAKLFPSIDLTKQAKLLSVHDVPHNAVSGVDAPNAGVAKNLINYGFQDPSLGYICELTALQKQAYSVGLPVFHSVFPPVNKQYTALNLISFLEMLPGLQDRYQHCYLFLEEVDSGFAGGLMESEPTSISSATTLDLCRKYFDVSVCRDSSDTKLINLFASDMQALRRIEVNATLTKHSAIDVLPFFSSKVSPAGKRYTASDLTGFLGIFSGLQDKYRHCYLFIEKSTDCLVGGLMEDVPSPESMKETLDLCRKYFDASVFRDACDTKLINLLPLEIQRLRRIEVDAALTLNSTVDGFPFFGSSLPSAGKLYSSSDLIRLLEILPGEQDWSRRCYLFIEESARGLVGGLMEDRPNADSTRKTLDLCRKYFDASVCRDSGDTKLINLLPLAEIQRLRYEAAVSSMPANCTTAL